MSSPEAVERQALPKPTAAIESISKLARTEAAVRPDGASRRRSPWRRSVVLRVRSPRTRAYCQGPRRHDAWRASTSILHAGDIERPRSSTCFAGFPPSPPSMEDVDNGRSTTKIPDTTPACAPTGNRSIILRDLEPLLPHPGAGFDVIVSGHSHIPKDRDGPRRPLPRSRRRGTAAISELRSRLRRSTSCPMACDRKSTILQAADASADACRSGRKADQDDLEEWRRWMRLVIFRRLRTPPP